MLPISTDFPSQQAGKVVHIGQDHQSLHVPILCSCICVNHFRRSMLRILRHACFISLALRWRLFVIRLYRNPVKLDKGM